MSDKSKKSKQVRFGVTTIFYPPSSRTPSPNLPSEHSTHSNHETTEFRPNNSEHTSEILPPPRDFSLPAPPVNHSRILENRSTITSGQQTDNFKWDDYHQTSGMAASRAGKAPQNTTDPAVTSVQGKGGQSRSSSSPNNDSALCGGTQPGKIRHKDSAVNQAASEVSSEEAQQAHKEYLRTLSDPFNVQWKLDK